jgi:transcriptional regulator with XRE-family HTH domain
MPAARFTVRHEHLATLLREAREESGQSQVEIARKLGRPQSFVAKTESQERRLDVIEFLDLVAAIGVRPEQLLKKLR